MLYMLNGISQNQRMCPFKCQWFHFCVEIKVQAKNIITPGLCKEAMQSGTSSRNNKEKEVKDNVLCHKARYLMSAVISRVF